MCSSAPKASAAQTSSRTRLATGPGLCTRGAPTRAKGHVVRGTEHWRGGARWASAYVGRTRRNEAAAMAQVVTSHRVFRRDAVVIRLRVGQSRARGRGPVGALDAAEVGSCAPGTGRRRSRRQDRQSPASCEPVLDHAGQRVGPGHERLRGAMWDRRRRYKPPRALSLECQRWAASRQAVAARLVGFCVPVRRVVPPEMAWRGPGQARRSRA